MCPSCVSRDHGIRFGSVVNPWRETDCAPTVQESNVFNPFELSLSEKQIPRFVGNVSSRSDGRSCWSRVSCAQGRCATKAPQSLTETITDSRTGSVWRALGSYSAIASCGVELMSCKSCNSENQRRFNSEINVHLPGLQSLDRPPLFVFPKLLVCLDCGFTEFDLPETELRLLGRRVAASGTGTCPTQGWIFDLSGLDAGLPFSSGEIEVRESAADKPLAMKNSFYRQ